jgi:hypothetical protein
MFGVRTNAGANDLSFQQSGITYMGNIATAMSLSIGQKEKIAKNISSDLTSTTISIAEVLSAPATGQAKLIGNNMIALTSYVSILSTDIPQLLDNAVDRTRALREHISLLKSYYNRTNDRLTVIGEQIWDLQAIIDQAAGATTGAKSTMESSYDGYDYTGVDSAIDTYIEAKNNDTRARVYLIYLARFQKNYQLLQAKNLKLIDTLTQNSDALIKRSTVVIPNSGSELIKSLKLIQTEAEASTAKISQ